MRTKEMTKSFRQLTGKQKLQYIWDYYKFPIVVACILVYIAGYLLYGQLTKKDTVLHTALINISAGESSIEMLSTDFLESQNMDSKKNELLLTTGLYLTDDTHDPNFQYAHASQIKLLASIDNEELDVVLMDKKVFDFFTENDYLYNLKELLSGEKDSSAYAAITEESPTGINLSNSPLIKKAGFEDTIYLGVIKNTTHIDMTTRYIRYFFP